jgi:outer membrane protein TolC
MQRKTGSLAPLPRSSQTKITGQDRPLLFCISSSSSHHVHSLPSLGVKKGLVLVRRTIQAAILLLIGGCATYRAVPLDDSAVQHRLAQPSEQQLQVRVNELHHPLLPAMKIDPAKGLTPDEAAVVAVVVNPALRAERDRRDLAQAALVQAGILPNPQISYNYDWVTGGNTAGTVNAYGLGLSWDITSLISYDAKVKSASAAATSVDLDVAWQEWQIAEAAKTAVYDLLSLREQLALLREVDQRLAENLSLVRQATEKHMKTAVDLAAAEAAGRDAHAAVLQTQRDLEHQRLTLNKALGVAPDVQVRLREGLALPDRFDAPSEQELSEGLTHRRLDLLGLKRGYQSQEQTLRAAVLDQFPKINVGFNRASDTTDVHTAGFGVTIDIPLFDRNQGVIATEKATRQKLFDEYINRVFEARSDVASALEDIQSINAQIADAQAAVPSLRHLLDVYKNAMAHGNADVLSYYQAWNSLSQKRIDVLKLKQQLADNRIALEIAAGRYFSDQPIASTQPGVER